MLFFLWKINNVAKGENADYKHYLLFPGCFQEALFTRVFNPLPRIPDF